MFTYHCPNCGQELTIPRWLPRTVTCENCHTKSVVPYDQDPDYNTYNALAKIKVKSNNFRTAHPNLMKGVVIASVTVAAGLAWLSTKDEDNNGPLNVEPSKESPEEQGRPLSITSDVSQDDSLPVESLSEAEESAPAHRKYAPRNPDDYETIIHSLGMIMVHLPEGWHPSQEKIDEFKEQTGEDLSQDMTFRSPHDHPYPVKKT